MPKTVKNRDYTMLSDGLPAFPPSAVGVALIEAHDRTGGPGTAWLRSVMFGQSPFLTADLIKSALNLGYDRI